MSNIILLSRQNYFQTLREQINASRTSIDILLYQFNRYIGKTASSVNLITQSLLQAHERNISIRIILNANFRSAQSKEANEKTVAYFVHLGIPSRLGPAASRIHAKTFIFDNQRIILGSHNLSERALKRNIELSLFIENQLLAQELSNIFNSIWNSGPN